MDCPLCRIDQDELVWLDAHCRVIRVTDPDYAGFCRVVWNDHIAEMTDLAPADRHHLLDVVMATETALRTLMRPAKINLASFGNMVPHLHWHVIPRFTDDRHFPESVWGRAQRAGQAHTAPDTKTLATEIDRALLNQARS
ncbi:MAG: HIT family protein [Betaproteobacteria bacterium HGW-Betaproteobacteria-21]|nr:MAG: HIT family protein [Betaproteobacteria bacterium HGW-Betaproteobacteria-21]